jgi:small subunit ribosomal protein S9
LVSGKDTNYWHFTLSEGTVVVNVQGGGPKDQATAIKLAIARALCEVNGDFRPALKKQGLLRRDPTVLLNVRNSENFSKRKHVFID